MLGIAHKRKIFAEVSARCDVFLFIFMRYMTESYGLSYRS